MLGARRLFAIPPSLNGTGQFAVIQSVAPAFGVDLSPVNVRDPAEIERAVTAFARSGHSGWLDFHGGPILAVLIVI